MNLEEVFLSRTPMLRSCPGFLRGLCGERYRTKLVGDTGAEERAWKLFGLVPVMLLGCRKCGERGVGGTSQQVWQRAVERCVGKHAGGTKPSTSQGRAGHHHRTETTSSCPACNRVQQGQVSRTRQELIGAALARKPAKPWRSCKGEGHKERVREIPDEVMASKPDTCEFGHFHILKVLVGCTFEQHSWPRRVHLRNAQSVFG